jgi:hypothetical protein
MARKGRNFFISDVRTRIEKNWNYEGGFAKKTNERDGGMDATSFPGRREY